MRIRTPRATKTMDDFMLNKIEGWIDFTLSKHMHSRVSCDALAANFSGFYSREFLARSYYVLTDELPKPDFPELYAAGLGDFLEMDADGITYKDTYFIKPNLVDQLDLHFHELVHVAQWQYLGAPAFIERYIREYKLFGYETSPLEEMAYSLQRYYCAKSSKPIDILAAC